jgi:hypothetical protein
LNERDDPVVSVTKSKTDTSDPTLAAITEAIEQITQGGERRSSAFDWDDGPVTAETSRPVASIKPAGPPAFEPAPETDPRNFTLRNDETAGQSFTFRRAYAWGLIALLGAAGIVVYFLAWSSPTSAPPATVENKQTSISASAGDKAPAQTVVQALPQRVEQTAGPQLLQSLQSLERRLTNLEQGIEQIKANQAMLNGANAELVKNQRQEQEKLTNSIGELAGELRTAVEKAARERSDVAEQIKAQQEQLISIDGQLKASQQQIERLKAAPLPQPRVVRATTPSPHTSVTPTAPKPAPRSPSVQARVPPQSLSPPPPAR